MATTLQNHYAARAAVEQAVGEKLNEIAAIVAKACAADPSLYPDGLTVNLSRAQNLARTIGPMLAPLPAPEFDPSAT